MATSAELADFFGNQQFARTFFTALSENAKRPLADPREDTADPPYDQGGGEKNDREKWALHASDASNLPFWQARFVPLLLAAERMQPIATIEAYTDDQWIDKVAVWVDVQAKWYDDTNP